MPRFSKKSIAILETCHELLQRLFMSIIIDIDCTVVWGYRNEYWQNLFFSDGRSTKKYPNGKHNKIPSEAVDVYPYIPGLGISFDIGQCYYFAGQVVERARQMEIPIITGSDWDSDGDINDQVLIDTCHFQINFVY